VRPAALTLNPDESIGDALERTRALLALPAIVAYNAIWSYAEARGHLDALRSERLTSTNR